MTGQQGQFTTAWADRAGMRCFDTFRDRCKDAIIYNKDFKWPDTVTEVTYDGCKPFTLKKKDQIH